MAYVVAGAAALLMALLCHAPSAAAFTLVAPRGVMWTEARRLNLALPGNARTQAFAAGPTAAVLGAIAGCAAAAAAAAASKAPRRAGVGNDGFAEGRIAEINAAQAKVKAEELQAKAAAEPKAQPKAAPVPKKVSASQLPTEEEVKEIKMEMERAMFRVEALEVERDDRDSKLIATKDTIAYILKEKARALAIASAALKEVEVSKSKLVESVLERESALARIKELEAAMGALETRAMGLESTLSLIGTSVGAALRNTSIVAEDVSLFDKALSDATELNRKSAVLEKEKEASLMRADGLEKDLGETQKKLKLLERAAERAMTLAAGVKEIFSKTSASSAVSFFSFFQGPKTEEEMIKDTIKELEDLRGKVNK